MLSLQTNNARTPTTHSKAEIRQKADLASTWWPRTAEVQTTGSLIQPPLLSCILIHQGLVWAARSRFGRIAKSVRGRRPDQLRPQHPLQLCLRWLEWLIVRISARQLRLAAFNLLLDHSSLLDPKCSSVAKWSSRFAVSKHSKPPRGQPIYKDYGLALTGPGNVHQSLIMPLAATYRDR